MRCHRGARGPGNAARQLPGAAAVSGAGVGRRARAGRGARRIPTSRRATAASRGRRRLQPSSLSPFVPLSSTARPQRGKAASRSPPGTCAARRDPGAAPRRPARRPEFLAAGPERRVLWGRSAGGTGTRRGSARPRSARSRPPSRGPGGRVRSGAAPFRAVRRRPRPSVINRARERGAGSCRPQPRLPGGRTR